MSDHEKLAAKKAKWKEEHLKALAYAFAWVAAADRDIAFAETHRFPAIMREMLDLDVLPFGHITAHFDKAVKEILKDPEAGFQKALEQIRRAIDHDLDVEDVIAAARIAVVADLKIEKVEETALKRLAEALGVDSGAV